MRILLVEDESTIANFIREGLEEEGFLVDVADNGRQGSQMALRKGMYPLLGMPPDPV